MSEIIQYPRMGKYSFKIANKHYVVTVDYTSNPFKSVDHESFFELCEYGENYHHVHFEFHGDAISETGYFSHFIPLSQVDKPVDYAIELATQLYQDMKKNHPKRFSPQLSLF